MRITLTQLIALVEEVKSLRSEHLEITEALSAKEAELMSLGVSLEPTETVEPNGAITPEDWTSPNVVDIPAPEPEPEPEMNSSLDLAWAADSVASGIRLSVPTRSKMYLGTRPRRIRKDSAPNRPVVEFMYLNTAYVAYARKTGIGTIIKGGHPKKGNRSVVWLTVAELEICAKRARKPRK